MPGSRHTPTVASASRRVKSAGRRSRAPEQLTRAGKRDAYAVLDHARHVFQRLDIRALSSETASGIASAARHILTRFSRRRVTPAKRRADIALLQALLDRVLRGMSAEERAPVERDARALEVDPHATVSLLTRALAAISDVLRATMGPWDSHVIRRFGIVCRPDGLPFITPHLMPGEALGVLVDELEFLAIPTQRYTLHDHDDDEHDVVGPAPDAGVGFSSIDRLRAWRRVSLAKIKKEMELLPPPARRKLGAKYGPDFPFACALAGLSSPGSRGGGKNVDIVEYLTVERFGIAPKGSPEMEENSTPTPGEDDVPELPSLPPTGRRPTRTAPGLLPGVRGRAKRRS